MRATRAAVFLTAALGCSGARPAGSPAPARATSPRSVALEELLRNDLAADHALPWSRARRLVWSDFQGPPPSGGQEGARISYGLFYAWKCRGQAFEFRVIAAFRPRQSWVREVILRDSAQSRSALRHEQTHFDLTEVHARGMRRHFAILAEPCAKGDAELNAIAQRLVQQEKAEQRRYDAETRHGLLGRQQAAWDEEVARRLAGLARYAP